MVPMFDLRKREILQTRPQLAAAVLAASLLLYQKAHAGARFIDVSLSGSYNSDIQKYQTSTRRSLGIELGLPLTNIFDVSVSHTQILDRDVYNEIYRQAKIAQGVTVPNGDIEQKTQIADTSVNASMGYLFGYIKPAVFGGALWRRSCLEDTFQDYGCVDQDATWNAGLAVSAYITSSTRFRVSYRRSPSAAQESEKKSYDELTSFGLTWSL